MKEIYVLNANNKLEKISSGATDYKELKGLPFQVHTLDTTVEATVEGITLKPSIGHKWTEDEVRLFCGIKNNAFDKSFPKNDGRYDIVTELNGQEILIIDTGSVGGIVTKRCRRITAQYDWIFSEQAKDWVNISDTSAGQLIFSWTEPEENITFGTRVVLKYNYYSATGKIGTVKCSVNNILKRTDSVSSSTKEYEMDITNYLSTGTNTVLLTVEAGGKTQELYTTINVINLTLESPFHDNQLYQGGIIEFVYSLHGSVEKTIHFQFNEDEPISKTYVAERDVTNEIQPLQTKTLHHGMNSLKVWATAIVNESQISTTILNYNIPFWVGEEGGTIISIDAQPESVDQGATAVIKYTPYNAVNEYVPIELIQPESFKQEITKFNAASGQQRSWSFIAKELGENLKCTIKSNLNEVNCYIKVVAGQQINYEQGNLRYELDLIGRDNALANRDVIEYKTIDASAEKIHDARAEVSNFNFSTDAWLTAPEEGDRDILRINATSQIKYQDINLFTLLNGANSTGCTFELDFKGRNTTNANKSLVTLYKKEAPGITLTQGIIINEQSVVVNLSGSIFKVEYKAEERIRITVTIGANKDNERLVMIYINGVLSYVSEYTESNFSGYKSDLILNPNNGFLDIYGLRIYGTALNMKQVLNNYIASYNTNPEKIAQREWNNIYDEDGNVSFEAVRKTMPTFVFRTVASAKGKKQEQNLPPAKKKKRYGPVDYYDNVYGYSFGQNPDKPKEDETYNDSKEKPVADVQGTSSQKYPRKNFKIKTRNKHSFNDAIVGEKVFTFKKDFMDSSHANNTGLAKLVQTLYFTPVPPQISYYEYISVNKTTEGEPINYTAYDTEGRRIDYQYIFDHAAKAGKAFASIMTMKPIVKIMLKKVEISKDPVKTEDQYWIYYSKDAESSTIEMCQLDVSKGLPDLSGGLGVDLIDNSKVRTTIFGQPCAFFYSPMDGPDKDKLFYQGVYNFNTDKVAVENMKLEEEGALSFEFANNVNDGALFKACPNFTEVRSSFEYRAYQKDGISIEIWEDYYDDDLVKWADGGYDPDEEADIPQLSVLYGTNAQGEEKQLYTTTVDGRILPINYPYLTQAVEGFLGEKPETLEAQFRLQDGNIEAAHVAASALSQEFILSDTINDQLGGKTYFDNHPDCEPSPKKEDMPAGQAIGCQIINQDKTYLVQWGYEVDGNVKEWTNLCYVSDLLTTLPPEHSGKVVQSDVSVKMKKGSTDIILWYYRYPIERTWYQVLTADQIFSATRTVVEDYTTEAEGQVLVGKHIEYKDPVPFVPISLRKFDMFEKMHQPIMDVINWVCDCYDDYKAKKNNPEKFKAELEQHLNKEYVLTYYVMALFAGAADSLAKNMFWNSYDGGKIWYPVWYDIDTCFGLSNDGHPNFPYSLEIYGEGSKLGSANIYNGADSHFWQLIYAAYKQELQETYNLLRAEKLTYESVMEVLYNQQISKIAPAHYNEDAAFSYLPYPSYYYTAQGSRYERLKQWVSSRFAYLDSKLEYDDYKNDSFEIRNNAVLPIEVTSDATLFLGVKYGQHVEEINKKRCEANQTIYFNPTDYGITQVNDLETVIFGASHIKSLGDLSNHQVTSIKFSDNGISVLEDITIGNEKEGYTNDNFTTLSVGHNPLLKSINVANCINLGKESATLNLTHCPNIRTVLANNTKLTNIALPEGSPIEQLSLPSIGRLELVNQVMLKILKIDSYSNLGSITWENVPHCTLKPETILNSIYDLSDKKLSNLRIIDYSNSKAVTTAYMEWLMTMTGINDIGQTVEAPYITGQIAVQSLSKEDLIPFITQFNKKIDNKFACLVTFDEAEKKNHYWALGEAGFVKITEEASKTYKLHMILEQIVAENEIFGVTGEGELYELQA